MGTIAEKLRHLAETKTAIKNAIAAKGVAVSERDTFRSYATKIGQIKDEGKSTLLEIPNPQETSEIYFKVEIPNGGGYINFTFTDFDWTYSISSDGVSWSAPIECIAENFEKIIFRESEYPLRQALVKVVSKGAYEPRYLNVNLGVGTYVCIPTEYTFIDWYRDASATPMTN